MDRVLEIILGLPRYLRLAAQLIRSVRSLDEAIRHSSGQEPPEALPEDWDELLCVIEADAAVAAADREKKHPV